ncbi:MAG: hypothetical protein IJA83_10025 [Clostridia bacterium]|nr:hypothetical protein [Clostridia bacterium]
MKLRSYQLCRWCDALWHGRRKWLSLALCLAALLLGALLGLTWLALPCLVLAAATLAVYLLHLQHAFGAEYQRTPRPRDAMCETVLIDADLIGQGTRLRAAAQPIDPAESLSMRLGSGSLLLGAAMTLTADALDAPDRSAILSAVHGLNIKPDRMRSQYPVMRREMQGAVTVVTVRDGVSQRRYYMGPSGDVADLCPSIWEGHTRPMEDYDHLRIADTASYIAAGNCRVNAYATALEGEEPIFLGLCGLGEEIDLMAVQEVSALRAMGLTVMLSPAGADSDLTSLLALLDLPDFHARADLRLTTRAWPGESALCVRRRPGDSLQAPVQNLRAQFRLMEDVLRRFALYLLLPLAICLLTGCWGAALVTGAMLLFAAMFIGTDAESAKPPRAALILLAGLFLLARAVLLTQTPDMCRLCGGVMAMCMALTTAIRLCGSRFRWKGLCLVLPGAAGAYIVITVTAAFLSGTLALLPLGFAGLISAAAALMLRMR